MNEIQIHYFVDIDRSREREMRTESMCDRFVVERRVQ